MSVRIGEDSCLNFKQKEPKFFHGTNSKMATKI